MTVSKRRWRALVLPLLLCVCVATPMSGTVNIQCPAPLLTQTPNGSGGYLNFNPQNPAASTDPGCQNPFDPNFFDTCKVQIDPITNQPSGVTTDPLVICRSITCGDGHVYMADRDRTGGNADQSDTYVFGFSDVTNVAEGQIMTRGNPAAIPDGPPLGAANISAPTLFAKEGQQLYLTLVNTGMRERPDLFDPHRVHYHGFPNAAWVFDGEPRPRRASTRAAASPTTTTTRIPGPTFITATSKRPSTCRWGCSATSTSGPRRTARDHYGGKSFSKFVYNDCPAPGDPMCGSTGYDMTYFLQETGMDPVFHDADHSYNRLSFADMKDTYPLLNGRGYPDTVDPNPIVNVNGVAAQPIPAIPMTAGVPMTIAADRRS